MGRIVDGVPPSGEATYVDFLLMLDAGDGDTRFPTSGETYNREQSLLLGPLPYRDSLQAKVESGSVNVDLSTLDVDGFVYLLGKYDAEKAGSLVSLVPVSAGTVYVLPEKFNNKELSHYTVFATVPVPDGGATLMLLGGALVGVAVLRRRFGR